MKTKFKNVYDCTYLRKSGKYLGRRIIYSAGRFATPAERFAKFLLLSEQCGNHVTYSKFTRGGKVICREATYQGV